MLRTITDGSWQVEPVALDELPRAIEVVTQYRGLDIGLTDAANVVLAHRFRTATILTLDHRHFDVVRQLNGQPFDVLPRRLV
jgi:predicted nucleic acid-binding protein